MRAFNLIRIAALFLAASFSYSSQAAEKWRRADTHHFIIYSDGSEQQLRDFAIEVERFDALLRVRFERPTTEAPSKLTIYMLSTSDRVARLMGKNGRNVAGFYRASRNGSFAVANRAKEYDKTDLSGTEVLFHEYAHHFMYRDLPFAYPAWFREGFAEYLSTVTFDKDGVFTLGMPAYHRAYSLVLASRLPIDKILYSDWSDLKNESQVAYFYGRSWLLVHWLMSNAEGRKNLGGYLTDFGKGVPPEEAARKNFGDFKELDKALNKYLESRMSYSKGTQPLPYRSDIALSLLDPVDSQIISLQLQRVTFNDLPGIRTELTALSQREPGRKEVWLALARAQIAGAVRMGTKSRATTGEEKDEKRVDEEEEAEAADADFATLTNAEQAVDKALEIDPKYGAANAFKAQIVLERAARAEKEDPALITLARRHIARANRADLNDPLPLILWHESYTRFGDTPDQTAHDGLEKAFLQTPEVSEIRVRYAYDLARQGKYDEAIDIVEFLASDPHQGEYGRNVLKQLQEMKERGEK